MCSQIFFRRSTQHLNASCFFCFIRSRIELHASILGGGGLHRRQRQRQSRGRGASGPAQPLTCGRPLHRRSHAGRSADPRHHFGDALRAAGELAVHGGGGVPHLRRRPRPGEGTEGVEGAEGAEGAEGPDSARGAEDVGETEEAEGVEGAERIEGSEGIRGHSIVVCNYFVLGVKAYGAISMVLCKPTRPTFCGRRRSPSLRQAQECVLLAPNVASMVVLYNLPHTQPFSHAS